MNKKISESASDDGLPLRVAIYTRISTDELNQPTSLESQEKALEAFAMSQGWEIVRRYQDQKSGATLDRPGLNAALEAAELHEFDLLLVHKLDRLVRSVESLHAILRRLDVAGVAFRSSTEQFDTLSPMGRFTMNLLSTFAVFERDTIIERVTRGLKTKASRGEWAAGPPPFGYDICEVAPRKHVLVPNDDAPVARLIFHLYTQEGLSTTGTRNELNHRGIFYRTARRKHSRPWTTPAVSRVLSNVAYVGRIRHGDEEFEGLHEPLVSDDTWEAAQARVEERRKPGPRTLPDSTFLLAGLLRCGSCGANFAGTSGLNRFGKTYRYYACQTKVKAGKDMCPSDRLSAPVAEQALRDCLLETYLDSSLFDTAAESLRGLILDRKPAETAELKAAERHLAEVRRTIDSYLDAFESGTLSAALCDERLREKREAVTALEARQAELQWAISRELPTVPDTPTRQTLREKVQQGFSKPPTPALKAFLRSVIREINVLPGRVLNPVLVLFEGSGPEIRLREDGTPLDDAGTEPRGGVRTSEHSVEAIGLEPTTSCLQSRCSSQLSYAPVKGPPW